MSKRSRQLLIFAVLLSSSRFVRALQIAERGQFLLPESLYAHRSNSFSNVGSRGRSGSGPTLGSPETRANRCSSLRETLLNFIVRGRNRKPLREVPVWQLQDSRAFFFVSGMTIDADGAPNAYNPDDTGLDSLSNAGFPGYWNGIVTDARGNPVLQRDGDPFPGYYVSCTSLEDEKKKFTDPTRYVDASSIPYVVLPGEVADAGGAQLGDFAAVMNLRNGKLSFAIYADIGTLGEGSVALAEKLGIRSDAREGGQSNGVIYLVFPGSGNRAPRSIDEIRNQGERLFYDWGGDAKLSSCAGDSGQSDDSVRSNRIE